MTPADQAKKIIDKYRDELSWIEKDYPVDLYRESKQCAAIHVQGIIDELPDTICGYMPEGGTAMEIDNFRKYFWKEVLNEIQST